MSNFIKILDEWAKYSEYDPEQRQFNLCSANYTFHQTGKRIEEILSEFDPTGAFAVIKAKLAFENAMKNSSIAVFDILVNPEILSEERRMYDLFQSADVKEAEKTLFARINYIYACATGKKLIGNLKQEDAAPILFECIDGVTDQIKKCQIDLYKKGGVIEPIRYVSTKINVFPTLSVCLTTLERAKDGLYICYIAAGGTADGYFGFYLVNNGNLMSVNDRVDEAVQGMHRHARNARWTEAKQGSIFPYSVLSYGEYDYLGYATQYRIDAGNLSFDMLHQKELYPLIIAIVLLSGKYVGKEINEPIKYVDSLLPINQKLLPEGNYALMKIEPGSIALEHQQLDFSFDTDKVLSGAYSDEFDDKDFKGRGVTGYFKNQNQYMVDLWGKGFVFSAQDLMKSDSGNVALLTDSETSADDLPPAEFVGIEKRMRTQAYYRVRKQLAGYMRERIHDAWIASGGHAVIKAWYEKALENNREALIQMALLWYAGYINGCNETSGRNYYSGREEILVSYQEKDHYPDEVRYGIYNGEVKTESWKKQYLCLYNPEAQANTFITFKPMNWHGIKLLTKAELPDIINGWVRERPSIGNSNLDVTDEVETVGTPYDDAVAARVYNVDDAWMNSERENFRYNNGFAFTCVMGFTKRGLNTLLKENGFLYNRKTGKYSKNGMEITGMKWH